MVSVSVCELVPVAPLLPTDAARVVRSFRPKTMARSRMRHRRDFQIAVSGQRVAGKWLVLHQKTLVKQGETPEPLVGYIVSKKVGNAVVRNRIQRRLRHVMVSVLTQLPAGSLLVVRVLPGADAASSAELKSEIASLLIRLQKRQVRV